MQRFFLNRDCFLEEEKYVLIKDPGVIHQINRVLRMRMNDRFIALDNTGFEFLCEITSFSDTEIGAKILDKKENCAEPSLFITLYQSIPKKSSLFEFVLQKGTEVGISKFTPLVTARTERKSLPKKERVKKILKEAAEQCERGKIPELGEEISFEELLKSKNCNNAIVLHGRGKYPALSSKINEFKNAKTCDIFVGPEGGFSEHEIEKAREQGLNIISLGDRVLRTETSGIICASVLLYS